MGSTLNKFFDYWPQPVTNIYNQLGRKRKRETFDEESVLQQYLEQPKKKKMVCTAKYIYKTLFLDGRDYDIRVEILGKEWKLHKIYLQQSPYFASMFSGSWNETNKSYITIEISDPNITLEALTVVFGSLYPNDEVTIEPCSVVGIVAAATLFQLDGLVDQCLEIMVETVSPLTAISYYNASCQYSLELIKKATFRWFNYNLMHYYANHPSDLRDISVELMESLVRSHDLCVIQMEYSLYLMLRSWIYLKIHPDWTPDENGQCLVHKFFKGRPKSEPEFLLTSEGAEFQKSFQGLRLENLIVHHQDLDVILEDRLIPEAWLYPTLVGLWGSVLQFDKNLDSGPVGVPESVFFEKCMRMGRVIESKETHTWRWNGYSMGLDLVWSVTPRLITVKRNMSPSEIATPLLLQHTTRHFMCRVVVISQDVQRQVIVEQTSSVMQVSLAKFQEIRIMELAKEFTYPVIISVYILVTTPREKPEEIESPSSTSD